MRVNGTLMNYYFHCKRQCYLHGNRLNLEDNSEEVQIGKALHEEKAQNENTEIQLENIRLDRLTKEYLTEIKKSDADPEASKWQLLYYLKKLKEKGIIRKGKLEFIEKNKESKKTLIVELGESEEEQLEKYIVEIEMLVQQKEVPPPINGKQCKSAHIMNIVIFRGRIWGRQNILCQWANYIGKIIHFVFGKMDKMFIFRLRIQKKFIV